MPRGQAELVRGPMRRRRPVPDTVRMRGAGTWARGTRARIALVVVCAFALSACETPYSIFWDASHRGQNNLITPSGRINVRLPGDYCNENALSQFPDHPDLFVGRTALDDLGSPGPGATGAVGRSVSGR